MGRNRAINLKDELLDMGISAEQILDYILGDYMSGVNAFQAMQEAMDEFFPEEDDEYDADIDDLQNN